MAVHWSQPRNALRKPPLESQIAWRFSPWWSATLMLRNPGVKHVKKPPLMDDAPWFSTIARRDSPGPRITRIPKCLEIRIARTPWPRHPQSEALTKHAHLLDVNWYIMSKIADFWLRKKTVGNSSKIYQATSIQWKPKHAPCSLPRQWCAGTFQQWDLLGSYLARSIINNG